MLTEEPTVSTAVIELAKERFENEERIAKIDTAKALILIARNSASAEEFTELARCVSKFDLTDDQCRRMFEALQPEEEPERIDRMMSFWMVMEGIAKRRDTETNAILMMALEIAIERYGEHGAEFSANLLYPLLPRHRYHLAGEVLQRMKARLDPIRWERSDNPVRRGGKTRVYRLLP